MSTWEGKNFEPMIRPRVVMRSAAVAFCALALGVLPFRPGAVGAEEEPAVVETRALSSQVAHAIALAAVQDCVKRGYKVAAAVVDRHGNLAAFLRDPLAGPHTIEISRSKAFTSATTQRSTASLSARTDLSFAPGMLLIVGGVPISFNGHFYGGVAVSGATPEVDEKCAEAGLEAVADTMSFVE
ncbi:MAG: heme-binding protein [Gammaproteobacteria bacterium]|nr:heme-binding protein [Gammaproteobacteria bacterium]